MSLFNTIRTSVSGLNAQSNALGVIGDNIANSGTTGYKDANAQFETLLTNSDVTNTYESGGVQTDIRYGITDQGTLTNDDVGHRSRHQRQRLLSREPGRRQFGYLTRAGSFVPDSTGNLINCGRLLAARLRDRRERHAEFDAVRSSTCRTRACRPPPRRRAR